MANSTEDGAKEQSVPAAHDVYLGNTLEDMPLEMLKRVDEDHDMNRIRAATSLINTFNYAIQVQAGRTNWVPSDYHRFIRALLALDSIGSEAFATAKTARLEAAVREAINNRENVAKPHPEETGFVEDAQPEDVQPEADVPGFLKPATQPQAAQPSRQAPLSSLPRRADDPPIDDLRLPKVGIR